MVDLADLEDLLLVLEQLLEEVVVDVLLLEKVQLQLQKMDQELNGEFTYLLVQVEEQVPLAAELADEVAGMDLGELSLHAFWYLLVLHSGVFV